MSEMKPKKRVNRGFIVSMVLLGAVVLYVIATQLMLIPQRNELKKAADTVRQTFEGLATMTQEDAARLDRDKAALSAKQAEIEAELAPLFVQDSGYLKPAVSLVMGEVGSIAYGRLPDPLPGTREGPGGPLPDQRGYRQPFHGIHLSGQRRFYQLSDRRTGQGGGRPADRRHDPDFSEIRWGMEALPCEQPLPRFL